MEGLNTRVTKGSWRTMRTLFQILEETKANAIYTALIKVGLLSEAAKKKEEKEKKSSNANGVLHELLVGKHLNGGRHMEKHPNADGETPTEAHDRLKKEIITKHGQETYDDMNAKAKDAADNIRKHLGKKKVKGVHWTSKPGDIERLTGKKTSQNDDASDIYVEHESKKFTGVSLKTMEKKGAKAPVGNPGLGTIDKNLGTNSQKHIEEARENLRKKHPKLRKAKTSAEAKAIIKSDPKIKKSESEERSKAMQKIAADHHKKLSKMTQAELWDHIHHSSRAHQTDTPHIRVTSSGTSGDYAHHIENPHEEHVKQWGERPKDGEKKGHISVELKNGTIHFRHAGTGARIKQRLKAEGSSGVFGSIKTSIE